MNVQGVMELFGTLFKLSYHSNISKPNSSPYFFLSFFLLSFFLSFFLLCSYNFYSVIYPGPKYNSLFLSCPCPESIYYRDHFFKVSPECLCCMMGSLAKYLCHLSFLFSFQGHPQSSYLFNLGPSLVFQLQSVSSCPSFNNASVPMQPD